MERIHNGNFGNYLQQLLLTAGIKNNLIANELNYDVSYISKWITGKAVPSKKNIISTLEIISAILVNQADDAGRIALLKQFNITDYSDLQRVLFETLQEAYYYTLGEENEQYYINNASLKVSPQGQFPFFPDFAKNLSLESELSISVMVDLYALDHISKLQMAGLKEQRFALEKMSENIKMDYIVDISHLDGSSVYDVLLFIHMMSNFSVMNFSIYHSTYASGKILMAAKEFFAGITLLGNNGQFMCTTSTRDKKMVEELYLTIQNQINPDKALFYKMDMNSLVQSRKYMQSLLSKDVKWLVGHITELFISPELFSSFAKKYFSREVQDELRKTHKLIVNAIKSNEIKIMFYNSSIMDFILSGELDFFNNKVILTSQQIREEVVYLKNLFHSMEPGSLKLVKEGFVDEFRYITNPCMFLSDTIQYLRLENKQYQNNILLVKEDILRGVFNRFFDKIWSENEERVISDHREISEKMSDYVCKSTMIVGVE